MGKDNKNIEQFFSSRLEQGSFQYREEDWEALSAKMDAAGMLPAKSDKKRRLFFWLLFGLFSFFSGYFFKDYWFNKKVEDLSTGYENTSPNTYSSTAQSVDMDCTDNKTISLKPTDSTSDNPMAKSVIRQSNVPKATANSGKPASPSAQLTDGTFLQLSNVAETDLSTIQSARLSVPTDSVSMKNRAALAASSIPKPLEPLIDSQLVREVSLLKALKTRVLKLDWLDSVSWQQHRILPIEKTRFRKNIWIELGLASELNSAGLNERFLGSFRSGLALGVSVHKNWAISGGVYLNSKRYLTSGKDYLVPEKYWDVENQGIIPDRIDGTCRVLDIPFMIHFEKNNENRLTWGISAGLSNYIIVKEQCNFLYDTFNPEHATGWESRRSSEVWAGVVNVFPSVRYRLNERASLVLAPYIKIPITEIGWGRIDLYSSGLNLAIRQQLISFN